jgi:hypothetical protein
MKPPLPVPERFCKKYKNKVEDEKHFILYCPLYKNLRNKYIINEESQSDSDEIYLISRILNPDAKSKLVGTYSYFRYERPIKFSKINPEILF